MFGRDEIILCWIWGCGQGWGCLPPAKDNGHKKDNNNSTTTAHTDKDRAYTKEVLAKEDCACQFIL